MSDTSFSHLFSFAYLVFNVLKEVAHKTTKVLEWHTIYELSETTESELKCFLAKLQTR